MGSMHTGLEEPGFLGDLSEMAEFYAARAKGGVGLIVTGGVAPNSQGRVTFGAAKMSSWREAHHHKMVTDAVHANGGKIAMQILHAGRYSYHFFPVSASAIKSPIGWFTPSALSASGVSSTIEDYVRSAVLAKSAGYDGVEVMGSEGYLINQFLVKRTNKRTDEWGGSYANRMRFPVEIVKRMRAAVGKDFIIIYRLSMLDLVKDGSSWEEIVELAKAVEVAGASIINTGIGWHEARVPTIATVVPRGAFAWVTKKMRSEVSLPLCTTNRINMPATAEGILLGGAADLVSMARPFLSDPELPLKAMQGRDDEINTCIGCNQACLDNTFRGQRASCLVNPVAGYETKLKLLPVHPDKAQHIAVVGAGPAGLACATAAASRGHKVTLFDKDVRARCSN
jgi:2,4-dienoyl-CoA reductase (NADPH2)